MVTVEVIVPFKDYTTCLGCLPAGVDPNLEAKRGRGSTRGERHQGDATGVTSSVSSSAPMVFTVQALLSLLSRRYVR